MPVYNKKGLDYFALAINHYDQLRMKRLRRLCRANGLAVYTLLLCQIYGGKGYFVTVTDELVEDLAEDLAIAPDEVKDIIAHCCKLGIFDGGIYQHHRVLTSADIQMSYVDISSRIRRDFVLMDVNLTLLSYEDIEHIAGVKMIEKEEVGIKVVFRLKSTVQKHSSEESTQNKEKKNKEKETYLPLTPSSDSEEGCHEAEGGQQFHTVSPTGVADGGADKPEAILPNPHTPCPRGEGRNYEGLVENLVKFRLEPKDINAILRMSNFGEVGDPVWQAIYDINNSSGRIKQPGKYIYSVINKYRKTSK